VARLQESATTGANFQLVERFPIEVVAVGFGGGKASTIVCFAGPTTSRWRLWYYMPFFNIFFWIYIISFFIYNQFFLTFI